MVQINASLIFRSFRILSRNG